MSRYEQMIETRKSIATRWSRRPDRWWDVLSMDPMPEDELWFEKASSYHMIFDETPGEQLHLFVSVPPFAKSDDLDRITYAGKAGDDVACLIIIDASRARTSAVVSYGKTNGRWTTDLTTAQKATLKKKFDALQVGYVLSA